MTVVLWIVAVALIAIGVAGTILPAIPGVTLVFLGMLLGAWIDQFARIPVWLVVIFAVLTAITWAVDYFAAAAGAKRAGASKLAVLGAMIGTVAGIFTGFVGFALHAAGRRRGRRIHRATRLASRGHRGRRDLARAPDRHRREGRDRLRDDRRVRGGAADRDAASSRDLRSPVAFARKRAPQQLAERGHPCLQQRQRHALVRAQPSPRRRRLDDDALLVALENARVDVALAAHRGRVAERLRRGLHRLAHEARVAVLPSARPALQRWLAARTVPPHVRKSLLVTSAPEMSFR